MRPRSAHKCAHTHMKTTKEVLFSTLVQQFEDGILKPSRHNPATTGKVRDSIMNHFEPMLVAEGSSIVVYNGTVKVGHTRLGLAAERKKTPAFKPGDYEFFVKVVYAESEDEATLLFNGSNIARVPTKAQAAFSPDTAIGAFTEKLSRAVGIPYKTLADYIGPILDSLFCEDVLRINNGGNHRRTVQMCAPTNRVVDIDDGEEQALRRALSAFSALRREAEYSKKSGALVGHLVEEMLLLKDGRSSPGFLVAFLMDALHQQFGGFSYKQPSALLRHMRTNAEDLFGLCKNFTRKQGNRGRAQMAVERLLHAEGAMSAKAKK